MTTTIILHILLSLKGLTQVASFGLLQSSYTLQRINKRLDAYEYHSRSSNRVFMHIRLSDANKQMFAMSGTSSQDSETFPLLKIMGVCGGIGSGKSYACSLLTQKINEVTDDNVKAHHIDTDSLAHGVYAPGSKAIQEIGEEFGNHVIADGTVDRKVLGSIVFADPSKMHVS